MPEVYLINGFLEAGKTIFINELLAEEISNLLQDGTL